MKSQGCLENYICFVVFYRLLYLRKAKDVWRITKVLLCFLGCCIYEKPRMFGESHLFCNGSAVAQW